MLNDEIQIKKKYKLKKSKKKKFSNKSFRNNHHKTLITEWNLLTQISTILMVRIGVNY